MKKRKTNDDAAFFDNLTTVCKDCAAELQDLLYPNKTWEVDALFAMGLKERYDEFVVDFIKRASDFAYNDNKRTIPYKSDFEMALKTLKQDAQEK